MVGVNVTKNALSYGTIRKKGRYRKRLIRNGLPFREAIRFTVVANDFHLKAKPFGVVLHRPAERGDTVPTHCA